MCNHYIDNQGLCHECGIVIDADQAVESGFYTLERVKEMMQSTHCIHCGSVLSTTECIDYVHHFCQSCGQTSFDVWDETCRTTLCGKVMGEPWQVSQHQETCPDCEAVTLAHYAKLADSAETADEFAYFLSDEKQVEMAANMAAAEESGMPDWQDWERTMGDRS